MRLTDCTLAGGSPPRPGAAEAPAAPRAHPPRPRGTPPASQPRPARPASSGTPAPGEEEQDHRKDPGFARPITLATTSSSRVGVLCAYFARFSFSRLERGRRRRASRPRPGGNSRGQLTRPGTGSRGPIAVGAEIGRLKPRAPGSQFTRRSCVVRRDATRTGRPAGVPCERSFTSFTGAVNRYNCHIVNIDVLNEVGVMPARGAQSC
jgi:hypothetical protein